MKTRITWAVIGISAMWAFFEAFEEFVRDSPPLWLQVAIAGGGVGAWLKFGDIGPFDRISLFASSLPSRWLKLWRGGFGSFVYAVVVIFALGAMVYFGCTPSPDPKLKPRFQTQYKPSHARPVSFDIPQKRLEELRRETEPSTAERIDAARRRANGLKESERLKESELP